MIPKLRSRKFLIILLVLSGLFLSMSTVCAEDIGTNETVDVEKEDSIEDNSKNTTIKVPAKPAKVKQSEVIAASKNVQTFADKNQKLPNFVTVGKYQYSMPEFLYLMSKTISNKNKKINTDITVKYDMKNPSNPSGTWVRGNIYSYYTSIYANNVIKFMDKNKKAPNFITTAGGNKLQYQSLVYLFAKTLSGTKTSMPYFVTIDIKNAHPINQYMPNYNRNAPKVIGNGSLGYVELLGPYGNAKSKVKVAYIIGMHPMESNSHKALLKTLTTTKNLKYAYYIYKITVTKNATDYIQGRMNGQLIANKYVLPNIRLNKYNLVVDVHSNQGEKGYEKKNFVFVPLQSSSLKSVKDSRVVANKLVSQIKGLSYQFPTSQTSPPYCAEPVIKSGTKTIIFEAFLYDSATVTQNLVKQLVAKIDLLKI